MEDQIIIKQSFLKQLSLTFLGVLMVGASLLLVVTQNDPFTWFIGIVGVVFFGVCLAFIVIRLIKPKHILIIDADGFTENSTAMAAGTRINWSEVQDIYLSSILTQKFICVVLKDPDAFMRKLPPIKKMMTKANAASSFAQIQINLSSTTAKYGEVLSTMKDFHLANQAKL